MEFQDPVKYLENLSVEVINNRFNDKGVALLDSFFAVFTAFLDCGVFTTNEHYVRAHLIASQILELYKD